MELNPLKQVRRASWGVLRLTRTAGLARGVLEYLVPSEHLKTLLRGEDERHRLQDETILRGVGELAILVKRGKRELKPEVLDQVWSAVAAGKAGVELDDVFDPHTANALRSTTPALDPSANEHHDI